MSMLFLGSVAFITDKLFRDGSWLSVKGNVVKQRILQNFILLSGTEHLSYLSESHEELVGVIFFPKIKIKKPLYLAIYLSFIFLLHCDIIFMTFKLQCVQMFYF